MVHSPPGGNLIFGAHVPGDDPLAEAASVGAGCIQMFLGDPQSWKEPPPRADLEKLKASKVPIYIHAPYLINVASPNNRIRIPSRKILAFTLKGAAEMGAAGVIVHAGHADDGVEHGFRRWWRVFEELESEVPVLIENTAGGTNAMGRRVEDIAKLWELIGEFKPGFCFDTCHAHAAGEDLEDVIERVLKATGRIDLMHANSSRDEAGSGADRHANFDSGKLDASSIVAMVKASKAPATICETPWNEIGADVAILKEAL